MPRARPLVVALVGAVAASSAFVACDGGGSSGRGDKLRLGYFPNVTHAPALVGLEGGIFEDALGPDVELDARAFNAGPEVTEAVLSGALDASYVGPNPAVNAFTQSDGAAIRVVAGAASGGAFLVVDDEIDSPEDLDGTTIASPQLGNTQDVALRTYLKDQGFETDQTGGGDVHVLPQDNAQSLETFQSGDIDGAWVPEPWATRLVDEGGGHVLVDERDLWPGGQFVTTQLVVRTEYLDAHPDVVKRLLEGHVAAIEQIESDPEGSATLVARGIKAATDKEIAPDLVTASFESITFTPDPIASSLRESATHAKELDLLDSDDLDGIYALDLVDEVLAAEGKPEVSDA